MLFVIVDDDNEPIKPFAEAHFAVFETTADARRYMRERALIGHIAVVDFGVRRLAYDQEDE